MIDPARFLAAAPWLAQEPLATLLSALDADGEEARVIGGAVRNTLIELPHGDIDIATTALPTEVVRRAQAIGFKAVPTGIEHGTVTVVAAGRPFEVTSLREDVETFGRKAAVRFGRDWQADAERRDFTMNALAVTRAGRVIDLVGGLPDLKARRVRFIGDPAQRLREDYLRILRFFRFHAAYGRGAPDPDGLHAAIVARAGLDQLSRERVRMELMKLLAAPGSAPTLAVMAETGLLEAVVGVPEIPAEAKMEMVEESAGVAPLPVRRLGALAVRVADDADRLRDRLRLANHEHARLAAMATGWWRVGEDLSERAGRALLYRLGPERFVDRVLLAWAHAPAPADDPAWRHFATLPQRHAAPRFPLRAADLIGRGVPRGPALGAALAGAEEAWIAADFPDDAATLEALAAAWAERYRA